MKTITDKQRKAEEKAAIQPEKGKRCRKSGMGQRITTHKNEVPPTLAGIGDKAFRDLTAAGCPPARAAGIILRALFRGSAEILTKEEIEARQNEQPL
jgi:hypothetical protein